MVWTKPVATAQSWGGITASTGTYTRSTIAASPWATVSAQPESSDGGIDFEMRFRDYPTWYIRSDRPILLQSSLSEGSP